LEKSPVFRAKKDLSKKTQSEQKPLKTSTNSFSIGSKNLRRTSGVQFNSISKGLKRSRGSEVISGSEKKDWIPYILLPPCLKITEYDFSKLKAYASTSKSFERIA